MFARNDYIWNEQDEFLLRHFSKSRRPNYLGLTYYRLKKVYKDDLHNPIWKSILTEIERTDRNARHKKKMARKQRMIQEIAKHSPPCIFGSTEDYLMSLDYKTVEKRYKKVTRKKKPKKRFRPLSMKQLRKSLGTYGSDVLLKDYLRADTVRLFFTLKPAKRMDGNYLARVLSNPDSGHETARLIAEMIEESPRFMRERLGYVLDMANELLEK